MWCKRNASNTHIHSSPFYRARVISNGGSHGMATVVGTLVRSRRSRANHCNKQQEGHPHGHAQLASQNYSYLTMQICGQVNCAHWRLHLCITVCLPAQQTVSWPPGAESHGQELLYWYLSLLCIRAHGGITAALWWSLPTQVEKIG
jgi:hypothetical protein